MILTEAMKLEILEVIKPKDGNIEAITSVDLQELMGWSKDKTNTVLLHFKKQGLLEIVKVYREDLDGGFSQRPGYILHLDKIISTT